MQARDRAVRILDRLAESEIEAGILPRGTYGEVAKELDEDIKRVSALGRAAEYKPRVTGELQIQTGVSLPPSLIERARSLNGGNVSQTIRDALTWYLDAQEGGTTPG